MTDTNLSSTDKSFAKIYPESDFVRLNLYGITIIIDHNYLALIFAKHIFDAIHDKCDALCITKIDNESYHCAFFKNDC